MKEFKQLKFYSQDEQKILEAVSIFKKLGYRVVDGHFNINEAKEHGGACVWDDREITSGWLDDDNFEQVTLEELKEMVGEDSRCNNNLSNNFTVTWEQVFGEKFIDSVIKAMKQNTDIVSKTVKQNKDNTMKNDTFTLERLLGCETEFSDPFGRNVSGYISKVRNSGLVDVTCDLIKGVVGVKNLTFFTEDGDELTFDEYVEMYYRGNCE